MIFKLTVKSKMNNSKKNKIKFLNYNKKMLKLKTKTKYCNKIMKIQNIN